MSKHIVATLVSDGISPFELGALCEVFGVDRSEAGGPAFEHVLIADRPGVVTTAQGFSITVPHGLDIAGQADIVCVPSAHMRGGHAWTPVILEAIRSADTRDAWIIGIGEGNFTLAESGVLDGRRATTHWTSVARLAASYPTIYVEGDSLFVEDRNVITCAGTAATIDACLHLVRRTHGAASANIIARRMVMAANRCSRQSQFVEKPIPADLDLTLAPLVVWMLENLDSELPLDALAARAHMSLRTFSRRFKAEVGTSPNVWLVRQRILRAQQLLERTNLPIEAIASDVGFASAAVLRQNFSRVLGTSPTAYRDAFACPDRADEPARHLVYRPQNDQRGVEKGERRLVR